MQADGGVEALGDRRPTRDLVRALQGSVRAVGYYTPSGVLPSFAPSQAAACRIRGIVALTVAG